MYAMFSGQMTE